MTRIAIALVAMGCSNKAAVPAPEPAAVVAPEPVATAEPAVGQNTIVLGSGADEVKVTALYHATVVIEHGDKTVWVDPWSKAALPAAPDADVVLITDIHQDHLDAEALAKVATDATVLVAPKAVADQLTGRTVQNVLANGESAEVAGMKITAVPMYNNTRGPEPGKLYHDKGRGNGYLVDIGETRIYLSGDTECTDEMKALTGVDLALVSMNLPYTMPPEEAAECVKAFKPAQVVPYHYAGSDLTVFSKALEGVEGVKVTIVDAYPGGLPW